MISCPHCDSQIEFGQHNEEQCREFKWKRICPPLYQSTDWNRLDKATLKKVMDWKFGSTGLVLLGPSGRGKSRMVYGMLKREHMAGRRIECYSAASFGHRCAAEFLDGDGEEFMKRLVRREILYLDDLDKVKLTDRVESELYGLIESRIANLKPVIATTQLTGNDFIKRFSDPIRGAAIVRRLREFCITISC